MKLNNTQMMLVATALSQFLTDVKLEYTDEGISELARIEAIMSAKLIGIETEKEAIKERVRLNIEKYNEKIQLT